MFDNKALRRLIVPLVIEQALVMLVGIADTAMISGAGETAVSGVALVDMIGYLLITLLTALATGGAVIVSQYLGSRDNARASEAAGQLNRVMLLFSLGLTAFCLLLGRQLLALLFPAVEGDVMRAAETYFYITTLSLPFFGLYNASAAVFRAMEKTRQTMYVSLMMNIINVAGNYIGVVVLRAGVAGVAIPTLISRAAAGVVMVALAFGKGNAVRLDRAVLRKKAGDMRARILRIAVPNGVENGLFALGRVLVTTIVALFGTGQIAANGVAGAVDMIAIMVVCAMNVAMVTVVGQCVGAREYAQATAYTKKLMLISYIATGALSLLVFFCTPAILTLFAVTEETRALSATLITMHNILATLLHPTSFNLSNSLRAAGDAKFTMYAGVASMLVFRLGTAVLLGVVLDMGILGVWIAMGMDWLARSVAFTARFRGGKWKTIRVI